MTVPPSGFQPRSWICAWLLLLPAVWGLSLFRGVQEVGFIARSPSVCEGLEAYARLTEVLPPDTRAFFLSDVPEPVASKRFFCAQYELAPRVLKRWWSTQVFGRKLDGAVILVHFDDFLERKKYYDSMVAEVRRQGIGPIRVSEPVAGVLVIEVGERP